MAKVAITIEDTGAETLEVRTDYGDHFHQKSNAHQYGNMVAQQLDRWLDRRGQETIVGNAPSGHAQDKDDSVAADLTNTAAASLQVCH